MTSWKLIQVGISDELHKLNTSHPIIRNLIDVIGL